LKGYSHILPCGSDYWKSYEAFIPKEKHQQTKAETFTVEGYNSRIQTLFGWIQTERESATAKLNT
jgi:insertion element IS1 protein InsB